MLHLTLQNFNARELIQNIFCPLVGAISSNAADEVCQKNNLSFVELLQPFSKISNDSMFRDSLGAAVSLKGIRLNICDVDWRPPQTILARKMLNDAVSTVQCENTKTIQLEDKLSVEIPLNEPWYELWRETFLAVQFPSDHEFTRHLLSCLIVVSSSEPNPVESAHQLTNKVQMMQSVTPPKLPKWFSTDPLNCYVMLHDFCTGDVSKAQQSFEQLKSIFGESRCFLLQLNSQQGAPGEFPDPWLRYLRKQLKSDHNTEETSISSPRTPQDISVTSMPLTMQMSALELNTPPSGAIADVIISHPLSPVQEQNSVLIDGQAMSSSYENIPTINPNVWASEITDVPEVVPHGMFLTPNDLENLKHFVQDYTIRALTPYIEKLVYNLNDAIANKKGVSRSLLTATKRWFGTNKPGVGSPAQNAVVYTNESTELQTRKLGDLYFMFGHYSSAFQAYHQAKRDFNADSAWQYYAGSLEMAALAAFMQGAANRKTFDYMEEAIVTYMNYCKLPQFATRATVLSVECLKTSKLYGEAAKQLIRMTSEDSDLRSGLLLEQASYSFLQSVPPLYRKYAFHSVLAGHRYSKAGQRKHAFRCYKQAYQVFRERGWSLAEDHIQYTIGKQALSLKKLTEASGALSHLLRPSSLQTSVQQGAFLREYIATHKSLQNQPECQELLQISLPRIVMNMTKVLVTSQPPFTHHLHMVAATNLNLNSLQHDEPIWHKLEEMCLQTATKKPVMIFKPVRNLFTNHSLNPDHPLAVYGEPIEISVCLENTIKIPITFSDINLLWTFTDVVIDGQPRDISNEVLYKSCEIDQSEKILIEEMVWSTKIDLLTIAEHEYKTVTFKLTAKRTGLISITGIIGQLAAQNDKESLWGKIEFEEIVIKPSGPQQIERPLQFDKRLQIQVLDPAPALAVSFSVIPVDALAGEIIPITMNYSNIGINEIDEVYIAFEHPRNFLVDSESTEQLPLSVLKNFKDLSNGNLGRDKEARKQYVRKVFDSSESGTQALQPNETRSAKIWLQVPYKKGAVELRTMVYYTMPSNYPKLRYRLVRHSWNMTVIESVLMESSCNLTHPENGELGIDVTIKNMNQIHHPISTEISLVSMSLFCPEFSLVPNSIVNFKSPGNQRIFQHNQSLLSSEMVGIRCAVEKRNSELPRTDPQQFIACQLSSIELQKLDLESESPSLDSVNSFLMKEETKYIRVFGQSSNNEEFNQIITTLDSHMTLVLQWCGHVKDNGSVVQRMAVGQHFIQMRFLYESNCCPRGDLTIRKSFTSDEDQFSIYDYETLINKLDSGSDNSDWAVQNLVVSRRCFVEEELSTAADSSSPVQVI